VARLAGIPEGVIDRAKEILNNLEQGEFTDSGMPKLAVSRKKRISWDSSQMTLFQKPTDPIRETLQKIDPDRLTPIEALTLLSEMKDQLQDEKGG
jgi:DNA mismatch repair protein MutS